MTAVHWLQLAGLAANVVGKSLIAKEVIVASRVRDLTGPSPWIPMAAQRPGYAHVLADISTRGRRVRLDRPWYGTPVAWFCLAGQRLDRCRRVTPWRHSVL